MDFLYFSGVKLNHFCVYYCHNPLPDWIADVEELDMAVGMTAQQKMQESFFWFLKLMQNEKNCHQTKMNDYVAQI